MPNAYNTTSFTECNFKQDDKVTSPIVGNGSFPCVTGYYIITGSREVRDCANRLFTFCRHTKQWFGNQ